MNLLCIRELIRKEFIQLFREKKNRALLVIAPLLQLIVFGYVVSTDVKDVTLAVLDLAHTRESRMLIKEFDGNRTFRVTHVAENDHELEEYLLKKKVHACLKINPDFSEKIKKGNTSDIQILVDGSMSNISAIRMAYINALLSGFNKKMIKDRLLREISYGRIDVRTRAWYNPNLDSYYFFVPGIVAFLVMLISLLFTSLAIIREKESGTMEQLIVTPVKPMEFIAGKTAPYAIISFAQMIMVILFALLWFKVPFKGSVLILFFGVFLFLMSTLGIGLFISAVSSTQQQAMMTTFFFILPFFML
ncbi:MAG: ABC transporter permease, partial [Deltaproteobacteria bacterium]|nr:ABC transporter permease [Deltaproteobacteria bacterium]